jgi:hypothetical protein
LKKDWKSIRSSRKVITTYEPSLLDMFMESFGGCVLVEGPILWDTFKDIEETGMEGLQDNLSPPIGNGNNPNLTCTLKELHELTKAGEFGKRNERMRAPWGVPFSYLHLYP